MCGFQQFNIFEISSNLEVLTYRKIWNKFLSNGFFLDGRPCVVDALCSLHDGIIKEVKAIREHWWRRRIRELFDERVLKGDADTLTGLLEPGHFESNVKSIRKAYEAYVLSIGKNIKFPKDPSFKKILLSLLTNN